MKVDSGFFLNKLGRALQISLLIIFFLTCLLRSQYLGELSNRQHAWLTASTINYTENWIQNGARNSDFLLLEEPNSIVNPDIESKTIYASQPSGAFVPIYLLKRIFPNVKTLLIIHFYSLLNHFFIALTAYWTVCILLTKKIGSKFANIYGFLSGVSYLLLPAPFYWHSVIYFSETAVILPFSIVILLEGVVRNSRTNRQKKFLLILQSIAIFVMTSIEWIALPTVVSLLFFRAITEKSNLKICGRKKFWANFTQLCTPVFVALSLYLIQIYKYSSGLKILGRFKASTNYGQGILQSLDFGFFPKISSHLDWLYSLFIIISIAILIRAFSRVASDEIIVPLVAFTACFLEIILLRNHAVIHNFSVLKLFFPLSISFFGILPAYISSRSYSLELKFLTKRVYIILGSLFFFLAINFPSSFHWFSNPGLEYDSTAKTISNRFSYNDVLFGFDGFYIPNTPPHYLALSKKLVKNVTSWSELSDQINALPDPAKVFFLYKTGSLIDGPECELVEESSTYVGSDGIVSFLVSGEKELESFRNCHPSID